MSAPVTNETITRARRTRWGLLGPAFVAAIAYVDPGNVAANLTAGAEYGYLLVWVLVAASGMAVLIQYLSAKLGIVTGKSLPEHVGIRLKRKPRLAYWLQAELIAAATDLAEVVGGAIALNLLFDLPLLVGGVIVGVVSLALLGVQSRNGQRPFEFVIIGLLAVIALGFMAGLAVANIDWVATLVGTVPRFDGPPTVLIAASMLGATVMPHVIYLHSALARDRHGIGHGPQVISRLLGATRWDVALSMLVAGAVNMSMLLLAAASLRGVAGTDTIEGAHAAITDSLGTGIGVVFGIGLLASGLASTSVGCYAGASIMEGLLKVRIPMVARRAITVTPALIILALGVNPTLALVISQVVLSFGIPLALIPLVRITADGAVMGEFVNSRRITVVAWTIVVLISTLNVALIGLTVTAAV
jgi:manganese transport protein